MKAEVSTLCRYASDKGGSLTIVDTFDNILEDKFPSAADFHFACRIDVTDSALGRHDINMSIIRDGNEQEKLFETRGSFEKDLKMEKLNLVAELKGLIFETAGSYRFCVSSDKENIISHLFKVLMKDADQL